MTAVQSYIPGLEASAFEVPDEKRQKALSQWFTDPDLAERVWRWMMRGHGMRNPRILEPSAGLGALIQPVLTLDLRPRAHVAYEVDPKLAAQLAVAFAGAGLPLDIRCCDFKTAPDLEQFDVSVFNPPYEDNLDVDFAEIVLRHCTFVGGIFAARMEFSEARADFWRWTDIRRKVVLAKRPKFGGGFQPMTDFEVLELVRRTRARLQGEASTCNVEWWW